MPSNTDSSHEHPFPTRAALICEQLCSSSAQLNPNNNSYSIVTKTHIRRFQQKKYPRSISEMPKTISQQKCPAFLTQVRSPLFDRASAPLLLLRRRFTEQLFHQIFKLKYVVELYEPLRGCNGCGKMLAVFLMAMIQNKSFFFHNLSRLVPISLNRSLFNNAFRIQ